MTALWQLADGTNKMTSVRGRRLLPLFKSRSEALTSLRGAFLHLAPHRLSFVVTLRPAPMPRLTSRATARSTARFCHAFKSLPTISTRKENQALGATNGPQRGTQFLSGFEKTRTTKQVNARLISSKVADLAAQKMPRSHDHATRTNDT